MTRCWIVTEGLTGTENQCLGVAEALGVIPEIKRINLKQPWRTLSPWLGFEHAGIFTGDPITAPWPDLALCSGRKAIAAARYIRKASGGKTLVVQIQDPRVSPDQFDMVAVPAHDPTRGRNVIVTTGAPNRINKKMLDDARGDFESLLSPLPAPRVAVMIGGTSKAYGMNDDVARTLATQLKNLRDQGCGLMITASRRTGESQQAIIRDELKDDPNVFFWDGTGPNPYLGFLAWADAVLVTADSVSMLSEAATAGKPVYIIPMAGGAPRIDALHQALIKHGAARMFEGKLDQWTYRPLNDAGIVALAIWNALKNPKKNPKKG